MREGVKDIIKKLTATDCNVRILSGDHKECVLKVLHDLDLLSAE